MLYIFKSGYTFLTIHNKINSFLIEQSIIIKINQPKNLSLLTSLIAIIIIKLIENIPYMRNIFEPYIISLLKETE